MGNNNEKILNLRKKKLLSRIAQKHQKAHPQPHGSLSTKNDDSLTNRFIVIPHYLFEYVNVSKFDLLSPS